MTLHLTVWVLSLAIGASGPVTDIRGKLASDEARTAALGVISAKLQKESDRTFGMDSKLVLPDATLGEPFLKWQCRAGRE